MQAGAPTQTPLIDIEDGPEAEELQKAEEKGFRALAAKANYMAVDVPNIQFPTKEVCRDRAKPSVAAYYNYYYYYYYYYY